MNQVKAVMTTCKYFTKYCKKCIRLKNCRSGEEKEIFAALKNEALEDWIDGYETEDIENDFRNCFFPVLEVNLE